MTQDFSQIQKEMGPNQKFTYEVTFNLHVNRTNEMIPTLANHKLDLYELVCMYGSVSVMSSMIKAGRPRPEFEKEIGKKLSNLRSNLDLKKIASSALGDYEQEQAKLNIFFEMLEVYDFELSQMASLGLVPADEYIDAWPTFIPKELTDPYWTAKEGDFDYKDKYPLSPTSEGPSLTGDVLAGNSLEK